jgi:hypothetical protein
MRWPIGRAHSLRLWPDNTHAAKTQAGPETEHTAYESDQTKQKNLNHFDTSINALAHR